jgi:plastocyanin
MASSTIGFRIDRAQERTAPRISKRTMLRVAIVVGAAAVAAALALLPDPAHAASTPFVVKMSDKQPYYNPEKLTVKPGDTVEWVNKGDTIHSVSTEAANAQNPKDVSLPAGAKPFDSGFVAPGGKYDYTFSVPGTYRYFCLPHEQAGMVGTIVVKK